ncbi:NUDIX hydrolase [Mangrovimicrobium sediminis]|uniref:NUDIX hydrolase n=1 Tax=Mangrovimicrobium sediminis TaxID=2562682 RepID=UPI001436C8DA|nr:NUDIX hydrolase [Haliea sp. SAOS-164]
MTDDVPIKPASTVALLRDSAQGIETLLLRRGQDLAFAPDRWVFPGGRLEAADYTADAGEVGEESAARQAAARESLEECGLHPDPAAMQLLSRWTTPVGHPRRFSTYIFAAPLPGSEAVVVDGGEICDYCWLPVAEALQRHCAGQLDILPPTMVTLRLITRFTAVDEFLRAASAMPVPQIFPVLCRTETGMASLYAGDAGYASADPDVPGARHRSVFAADHWVYTYEAVDAAHPPLIPLD